MPYTIKSYELMKYLTIYTSKFSKIQSKKKFPLKVDKCYLNWIKKYDKYIMYTLDFVKFKSFI